MELGDLDLSEAFPPWFWWVGIGLAAGCIGLLVLWYVKHPDRSILEDFRPKPWEVVADRDGAPGDGTPGGETPQAA